MAARTVFCTSFLLSSFAWAASPELALRSGVTTPGAFDIGIVGFAAPQRLQVAALYGTTRVTGARGALVGSATAGRNMNFAMMQAITRAGCLLYKEGGFLLQVDDSPEVLQLQGPDLAANLGNRVEIRGTRTTTAATVAPAGSVVDVTAVSPRSTGGCLTIAAALNAQTSLPRQPPTPGAKPAPAAKPPAAAAKTQAPQAAAKSGGGMSTGAKVSIVAALAGKKDSTRP